MYVFFPGLDRRFYAVRIFLRTSLKYDITVLVGVFHRIVKLYAWVRFKDCIVCNRRFRVHCRKSGNKVWMLPVIDSAPAAENVSIAADAWHQRVDAVAGHSRQGRRLRSSPVCFKIDAGIYLSVFIVYRHILVRHGSCHFAIITARRKLCLQQSRQSLFNGNACQLIAGHFRRHRQIHTFSRPIRYRRDCRCTGDSASCICIFDKKCNLIAIFLQHRISVMICAGSCQTGRAGGNIQSGSFTSRPVSRKIIHEWTWRYINRTACQRYCHFYLLGVLCRCSIRRGVRQLRGRNANRRSVQIPCNRHILSGRQIYVCLLTAAQRISFNCNQVLYRKLSRTVEINRTSVA